MTIHVALIGDHNPGVTAHRAIPVALELAAARVALPVEHRWLHTTSIGPDAAATLAGADAIWCVPASPYADTEGALSAIRYARLQGIPFLGTCGGFQHLVLEFARNALGRATAAHAELDPTASDAVIAELSCALVEERGQVHFRPGSHLSRCYGADASEEGYHCRYGLAPGYEARLERAGLRVSARDDDGEVRALELEGHPFYVGTLFQPERAALTGVAPPLVTGFLAAAGERLGVRS